LEGWNRAFVMKVVFCSFETKTEAWVLDAKSTYVKKIGAFIPFEIQAIKSPAIDREDAERKKKAEAEKFLKLLKPGDVLIVFDENGKTFKNSEAFATIINQVLERSPSRLIFLIGGSFGIHESVREKAHAVWSLSALTMNHWVAQVMALEQIYRALTILKKIPYHNR
jgi:23S rRNA (pseudouridine1915-N3)-methyltransferase